MKQEVKRHAGDGAAPKQRRGRSNTLENPHAFLIRIPQKAARLRAIMVLGEVRVPYCGFTDHRLLVTKEHLEALRKEGIPFEELS
jgi:hypothetical protein